MDAQTWQTEQFERHRAPLRTIGYRMLGSLIDADDAMQEAWLPIDVVGDQLLAALSGGAGGGVDLRFGDASVGEGEHADQQRGAHGSGCS